MPTNPDRFAAFHAPKQAARAPYVPAVLPRRRDCGALGMALGAVALSLTLTLWAYHGLAPVLAGLLGDLATVAPSF